MPGKAPEEQQCTATSKRSGERCKAWAVGGSTVCRMHGGKSPRGVASPHFTHGRFSKSIPARLAGSYEEVLADPRRLELDNELAVIVARNEEMLAGLYSGASDRLWLRMRAAKRAMEAAQDAGDHDAAAKHERRILQMIEHGGNDGERWAEIMANFDQQRRLAESERRRRIEDHQMATTEEVMALMAALVAIITRHVKDERVRRAIGLDIDALINLEGNGQAGQAKREGENFVGASATRSVTEGRGG
jgi:hypothetical protein